MDEEIKKRYEEVLRFDEGDLYYAEAYLEAEHACSKIEELLEEMYGPEVLPLLQEYAGVLYDITELEAMHYFEQGYLAGRNAESPQA